MGEVEARRRAAWRFVRAVVRSQAGGVVGAVLSGLLWQTGAISAPLIVSYTIDHGIVPRDRHTLCWLSSASDCSRSSPAACATSTRFATAPRQTPASATRSSRMRSGSTPRTTTASAPAS